MSARRDPSGDHAGAWLDFFDAVSFREAPVAASAIQICVSYALSSQFVSRTVYATHRPSGDSSGEPARFSERIWSMLGAAVGNAAGAVCAPRATPPATNNVASVDVFVIRLQYKENPSRRASRSSMC